MRYLYFLALALAFTSCSRETSNQAPNVILIITDDQGYGDLGLNGNTMISTPEMDKLGKESVRFTNFHSGTTCAPTRASLMTGVHCNTAGVWHTVLGRSFLNTKYRILPQYLKDLNYASGIFGKWHLGDNEPYLPENRGFEEVLIHGGGGVGQTPDYWNNDYFSDTYFHNGKAESYEGYCTDVWFQEAMSFMEDQVDKEKPFFTYISTNAPHGPFYVDSSYFEPYINNVKIPNANFYGMITNIDDNLGKLRAKLEQLDIEDNTILIFMTDNGTAAGVKWGNDGSVDAGFNAGMMGTKGSEYEGGHRVPLFIHLPPRYKVKSKSYGELTSVMDLLPTIYELCGGESEKLGEIEGRSLNDLIFDGIQDELGDRIVVADKQRVDRPIKWKNTAVMQENWRLVNAHELYNIEEDPGQRNNIAEEFPDIVKELSRRYDQWWKHNEEAFLQNNYLHIGLDESPALLTAHDWISDRDPPWNQGRIRAGMIDNGHWLIDVKQAGNYRVRLFRWPPSINEKINAGLPKGDLIPNGYAFEEGVELEIRLAQLEVQGFKDEAPVYDEDVFIEFEVNLSQGPSQLKTYFSDNEGIERGAYYVQVQKM